MTSARSSHVHAVRAGDTGAGLAPRCPCRRRSRQCLPVSSAPPPTWSGARLRCEGRKTVYLALGTLLPQVSRVRPGSIGRPSRSASEIPAACRGRSAACTRGGACLALYQSGGDFSPRCLPGWMSELRKPVTSDRSRRRRPGSPALPCLCLRGGPSPHSDAERLGCPGARRPPRPPGGAALGREVQTARTHPEHFPILQVAGPDLSPALLGQLRNPRCRTSGGPGCRCERRARIPRDWPARCLNPWGRELAQGRE